MWNKKSFFSILAACLTVSICLSAQQTASGKKKEDRTVYPSEIYTPNLMSAEDLEKKFRAAIALYRDCNMPVTFQAYCKADRKSFKEVNPAFVRDVQNRIANVAKIQELEEITKYRRKWYLQFCGAEKGQRDHLQELAEKISVAISNFDEKAYNALMAEYYAEVDDLISRSKQKKPKDLRLTEDELKEIQKVNLEKRKALYRSVLKKTQAAGAAAVKNGKKPVTQSAKNAPSVKKNTPVKKTKKVQTGKTTTNKGTEK